jgi:putative transposase
VYHVLNRANGRLRLFKKDEEFLAFELAMMQAHERGSVRILDWCIMPDHWHLVLWPKRDGELTDFMRRMTLMHATRWRSAHPAAGSGHLYQARFRSFLIEVGPPLLTVLRYVERNPVRAGLVEQAQDWRWGSCHVRQDRSNRMYPLLSPWPIARPAGWLARVNAPQSDAEEQAMKLSILRSRPFGSEAWMQRTIKSLGLEHTLRPHGRPRIKPLVQPTPPARKRARQ